MAFFENNPVPGQLPEEKMEAEIRQMAAGFPFPPTPDLAGREWARLARRAKSRLARRRWLPALAILIAAALIVLLVSPVRARLLDWIRIGAVRIFLTAPTPSATPARPAGTPPAPTPRAAASALDLPGETSLASAREKAGFDISLPGYPPGLGGPQHVFVQKFEHPLVTLVWMDANAPGEISLVLTEARTDEPYLEKSPSKPVQNTEVNGSPAAWVEGNYLLVMRGGDFTFTRLIAGGHTLVWTRGSLTFRLETGLGLEEAVRIAESIP